MPSLRCNNRVYDIFTFLQERQKTDFLVILKSYASRLNIYDALSYDTFYNNILIITDLPIQL